MQLKMAEPGREEFDTSKYPWLLDMYEGETSRWLPGYDNGTYDSTTGIATLRYSNKSTARAGKMTGTAIFVKHYVDSFTSH